MKRIKQISIWLIALAGLMTALGAAAQTSGNTGPLHWNYHAGTQTLTITGTGAMPDYASSDNQPWKAFREQIKTVTIGNGVTAIGKYAFRECSQMQRIELPASVADIRYHAFSRCKALESIVIPAALSAIGSYAFFNCTALTAFEVDPGNAHYTAADGVLYNKAKTLLIYYPAGKAATSFSAPAGVTKIGEYAFERAANLQNITLPAGVKDIESQAFEYCTALQSIALPEGLTTIKKYAFWSCGALQSIAIPSAVISIGEYTFAGCAALQQVTVAWDTPLDVLDNTFNGVNTADVTLKVPKGKEAAYQAAPVWKNFKINSPPVPGGGGKLTVSNITGSGFTVNWEKATDSDTPQNMLIYKVYCKSGNHIIFQSSDLVATLTDKTSYTITGLGGSGGISINPALGYDVNVKVVDADGSSAWYKSENVKLAAATV
ncbi:leucine-rich repeat domain-containing protein, partial [Tannerella forsythia]